jgi:hypothetical protein
MAKETFMRKIPRAATLARIDIINDICAEYDAQELKLSLRQLYYVLVSRNVIENTKAKYQQLVETVSNGRLGGRIDWDSFEDRARTVHSHNSWDTPEEVISASAEQYCEDWWRDQQYRPQVWVEKNALIGILEPICTEYRVPFYATVGNDSLTMKYECGKQFASYIEDGLTPIVLHLADHDPSGLDMTRDSRERLAMFVGEAIEVRRLGLNIDQVRRYGPPPNEVKVTDTKHAAYINEFGTECWELDALRPDVIAALIRDEIESLIDWPQWEAAKAKSEANRAVLVTAAERWDELSAYLGRD